MKKIKINRARCKKCNDIIVSKHTHDLVSCKCRNIFVDGGNSYLRRGIKKGDLDKSIEELSIFITEEE